MLCVCVYVSQCVCTQDDPGAAFDKVQHSSIAEIGSSSSSSSDGGGSSGSSRSFKLGAGEVGSNQRVALTAEQGKQQQQASAARGLAQGASWMILGVAVTAWQLCQVL